MSIENQHNMSRNETERDPQGWEVHDIDPSIERYLAVKDERFGEDVIQIGRALRSLHPQPGQEKVIIGPNRYNKPLDRGADFEEFLRGIAFENRTKHGNFPDGVNERGGINIVRPELPTVEELNALVQSHSRETTGSASSWADSGVVPYALLSGDHAGIVQFGTMDAQSGTRTQGAKSYFNR